jgi:DNA-damage-inducible protein J
MLDVQAPIHIKRNSGYWNALKVLLSNAYCSDRANWRVTARAWHFVARTRGLDFPRCLGYNVAQQWRLPPLPDNAVVRARIDARTKREAAAALKKIGLTVSDAFRLLLVRVAAEKALPFEPLNPNAETVAAMKAARRGDLVKVGKPAKLLRNLNAGD